MRRVGEGRKCVDNNNNTEAKTYTKFVNQNPEEAANIRTGSVLIENRVKSFFTDNPMYTSVLSLFLL